MLPGLYFTTKERRDLLGMSRMMFCFTRQNLPSIGEAQKAKTALNRLVDEVATCQATGSTKHAIVLLGKYC